MRTIGIYVGVVIGLVLVAVVLEVGFGLVGRPEPIQPYLLEKMGDENTLDRLSFIPHYSLFRGGSRYDRVIEEYTFSGGKFVLTQKVMYKSHYPLFGLGETWVEEVVLFDGS